MIKILLYNMKTGDTRWGDEAMLNEWNNNPEWCMWADFSNVEQQREEEMKSNGARATRRGERDKVVESDKGISNTVT